MEPADSYARFSKPEQKHGDSRRRQEQQFHRFCEAHGLTASGESFVDDGLSGYAGKHVKDERGKLKRYLELIHAQELKTPRVLVIEAWDRLSRMQPDETIALVSELLRAGVSIGVCRVNDIFRP